MSARKDWEETLKQETFDLPDATWQRMENDLRGWLVQQHRSEPVTPPSVWSRWLAGFGFARIGWALATLALVGGLGWWGLQPRASGNPAAFAWTVGQVLESTGVNHWNWVSERTKIQGRNARLVLDGDSEGAIKIRLERGEATFRVGHRLPQESFQVAVGACQVHVVGTVFSVGLDSLDSWVAVEEGRIRLQAGNSERLVDSGHSARCSELRSMGSVRHTDTTPDPRTALAPTSLPGRVVNTGSKTVSVADSIEVPSCVAGRECTEILSRFVRSNPSHPAVPEVAMRWGRLALAAHDSRDALVAFGEAARSPALAPLARLESIRVRVQELGQIEPSGPALDSLVASLKPGSETWREALRLRAQVCQKSGDTAGEQAVRTMLQGARTAGTKAR